MIKNTESISIEAPGLEEADLKVFRELPHAYNVTYENEVLHIDYAGGKHNLVRALEHLQKKDISFGRVYSELPTLNDVFLEITGKDLR
jgi:ABC-2 type transport system ATP-binding protein